MKLAYKYINFTLKEHKTKTAIYSCLNNTSGHELGIVKWYPQWRRYCYFPTVQAVYSEGCLNDISNFIRQLMEERNNGMD